MTHIDFFKRQAKNLVADYKTQYRNEGGGFKYKPRFFDDIEDLVLEHGIIEAEPLQLARAQHIMAKLAGFTQWNEMIKASDTVLELGKLLFENRNEFFRKDWENHLENQKRISKIFGYEFTEELKLHEFKTRFLPKGSVYRRSKRENFGFTHLKTLEALEKLKKQRLVPRGTPADSPEGILSKTTPYKNQFNYLLARLEGWILSEPNYLAKIKTELDKWNLEAQQVIIDSLIKQLESHGITPTELQNLARVRRVKQAV